MAVLAHGNRVYALGGMNQKIEGNAPIKSLSDVVETSTFDGTSLGPWTTLTPLPQKLSHLTVFLHGDFLFAAGGITGVKARTEILRARLLPDGTLGVWQEAGALPAPRATAAATVFLDHVYVLGGLSTVDGGEVDTVLRAPLSPAGEVGAFESLPALPKARAHSHQAPLWQGTLYSAAGSIDHAGQRNLFWGKLQ